MLSSYSLRGKYGSVYFFAPHAKFFCLLILAWFSFFFESEEKNLKKKNVVSVKEKVNLEYKYNG